MKRTRSGGDPRRSRDNKKKTVGVAAKAPRTRENAEASSSEREPVEEIVDLPEESTSSHDQEDTQIAPVEEDKKRLLSGSSEEPVANSRATGDTTFKRRPVKNLKQILALEKAATVDHPSRPTYASIDIFLPPHRPPKKYADISGFEAKYIDPQTKLRYSSAEEYTAIQHLAPDIVTGYLTLRRENIII